MGKKLIIATYQYGIDFSNSSVTHVCSFPFVFVIYLLDCTSTYMYNMNSHGKYNHINVENIDTVQKKKKKGNYV